MPQFREIFKRALPDFAREAVVRLRDRLAAPPYEDIVLHDYEFAPDPDNRPRLSLVLPSILPKMAFGGVTTGIEILLEIGKRTGADLRILLDDFARTTDTSVVQKCARDVGYDPERIEIVPRTQWSPRIAVRPGDVFYSYSAWTTLNIEALLREQHRAFGGAPKPYMLHDPGVRAAVLPDVVDAHDGTGSVDRAGRAGACLTAGSSTTFFAPKATAWNGLSCSSRNCRTACGRSWAAGRRPR